MTAETLLASLHLVTPELILAVGALALLMIGVFAGEKSATTVMGLAVALLIIVRPVAGSWSRQKAPPSVAPIWRTASPAS